MKSQTLLYKKGKVIDKDRIEINFFTEAGYPVTFIGTTNGKEMPERMIFYINRQEIKKLTR